MRTNRKNYWNQAGLKMAFLVILFWMISSVLFAQSTDNNLKSKVVDGGIGLGSIIAVVASWSRNKSILFAMLHGLLGWIYVVYFVLTREEDSE